MEQFMTSNWNSGQPMELIADVKDVKLRKRLMDAAMKFEENAKIGVIKPGFNHTYEYDPGLVIEVTIERKRANKPMIFYFTYSLNKDAWKEWVKNHAYMLEDFTRFRSKGILFMVCGTDPFKDLETIYHSVSPDVDVDRDKNPITIHLLNTKVVFVVHRDVFNEHEWQIKRIR